MFEGGDVTGAVGACATGFGQPLMMLVFGDIMDALTAADKVADAVRPVTYQILMIGAGVFVSAFVATYCFTCAGTFPKHPSHIHPILSVDPAQPYHPPSPQTYMPPR